MPDIVYSASLDESQVLKALQNIDRNIDKIASSADKEFQSIGKSAQASGVKIGAIGGVVAGLTTEFINLARQAVDTLVQIGEKSVETALQVDTLKARLLGIFDGSQEAADQAFTFIQKKSKELGIDLSELAGAFIPKTENLAQFERVAKIATALARSDPEQGAIGARIALIEALSGTFTSLQKRFEIPQDDIKRLKEAFDTGGMEAFLSEFEKVLDASGKGFDDLANTAQASFSRLEIAGTQILGRLGDPIVDSLQAASDKLSSFLSENEDDLIVFADTIGRTVGEAIDLIASIDLSKLDTKTLIEFADYIQRIVESAKLLAGQLAGLSPLFGTLFDAVTPASTVFGTLYTVLTNIDDAFYTAAQATAIAKASYAGLTASLAPLIDALGYLTQAAAQSASFDYAGAVESLGQAASAIQNNVESQAAFNSSLSESLKALDDYKTGVQDNKDAQQSLREELEKARDAGTGAADAIQAAGAAERKAAEDAEKLADAQAKVSKAYADAQKDLQRKLEDIDRNFERKRLDIAIEFAQKREDAAKQNVEKLADIQKKYGQEVDDAQKDLSRKEEDIARKYGDQRIDLEREQRQKRVDIEREYRLKLQDIQRQFLLDADEAEKNRDAVAFLRAMKERDKQVQDAQTQRDRDIKETQLTGQQKKQELDLQRQRELEDARIANERKLEDLKTNLDRQIEAQNTAYARQIEDLQIGEARKLEEAQVARQRDIDDAKLAYERKISDLQESLAAELEVLKAGNAALEEENARHNDEMGSRNTTVSERITNLQRIGMGSSRNTPTHPAAGSGQAQGSHPGSIPGFASGGFVTHGRPYIVGERGPELFRPNVNGQIVPNHALMTSGFSAPSVVSNNTYNSNNKTASLGGLLDAGSLDALLAAKVQNYLVALLSQM